MIVLNGLLFSLYENSYVLLRYIDASVSDGCRLLLDGRSWAANSRGFWVGPTIILQNSAEDIAMKEEIFGPVLSVLQCERDGTLKAIKTPYVHELLTLNPSIPLFLMPFFVYLDYLPYNP